LAAKKRASSPSATNVVAAARGKGAPSRGRAAWEGFKSLAGAVAIFLFIRTFFVEAFRIPSGSMIPTLLVGDWLFVNKLFYGPHIPFTSINLPGYADPARGDVVVFVSPYQADEAAIGNDATPVLVKRLVAVAGDTIYMRDALFHVNGIAQRQGYAAAANPRSDGNVPTDRHDWQHKFEIKGSRFGAPPEHPTLDNWGPMVVPAGHLFMLGDNRYNSKDARFWGFVPRGNVRGRPIFVYYSWNADDSDRPLPFLTDIRWSRLGTIIR
jgi:signal peptidase I